MNSNQQSDDNDPFNWTFRIEYIKRNSDLASQLKGLFQNIAWIIVENVKATPISPRLNPALTLCLLKGWEDGVTIP